MPSSTPTHSTTSRLWAWAKIRFIPAVGGAFLPFGAWGTFEVARGNTWGLIGGPILNWVVMMGMSGVYSSALVAAAFAVDRVFVGGRDLVGKRQFGALALAAVVALPTLAVLPLNASTPTMIALYCGGCALLIAGAARWLLARLT